MVALALALAYLPGAARAQRDKATDKPAPETVTDAQFVLRASAMDLAEINLGRLGARQATSADVKKFAQRMLDDHTKSSADLLKAANKASLAPAQTMDAQHRQLAQKILELKGADFDRMFMTHMVEDHQKAIALFEAASKSAKDADLKAFAGKTLPTLREHLKMAQDTLGKLKGTGKGGSSR